MKKIILFSLLLVFAVAGCDKNSAQKSAQEIISLEEAKAKALDFVNNNLMRPGTEVSLKEAGEDYGMYKIVINVPGQNGSDEFETYITKDGKKFFPQIMDIEETKEASEKAEADQAQANASIPKTDKPKVELFVMSFCPYGVIAEKAMSPVFDLLKDKADIQVRFIASIQDGESIDKVKSLHGAIEGIEDARQLCVAKNYDQEKLWQYINEINEKCYPIYRNGDKVYQECWETAARNAGLNINTLNTCVENDGPGLIQAEDKTAKGYGVSGSPTLMINGQRYNGARSAEAFKTAICNAFNTAPEECASALDSTSEAASGGCG